MQGNLIGIVRIGGSGQSTGRAVMASQGDMSLTGLIFGPDDYLNDNLAFNGKTLTVGEAKPGPRTRLGSFLLNHDILFKEGLIGGTLSSAWPLLNLPTRNPKLRYLGLKKINGQQVHVLEYESRKGGNLEIKLYFNAETFQHVRSEYEQTVSPPPVSDPAKAPFQKESHLKLTEEFSDYRKEGSVNLPHTYRLQLTIDTPSNAVVQDWTLTLSQFLFNKELPASQFSVDGP